MPVILEMFLSVKVIIILVYIYALSMFIVVAGFKWRGISRRKDVKLRATLMLGTFLFLSHSIGVMVISIMFLFLKINQVIISVWLMFILVFISGFICDVIYIFFSNYLWDRLAIDSVDGFKISIISLIIVTPWYFIANLF